MAKADLKTKENEASVLEFLKNVEHETRRQDSLKVMKWMQEITGLPPKMWGPSIVGFGSYHYKYDSGREGDMLKIGFSPRKAALTLYIMGGFPRFENLMSKLGKYKTGKSCLYIKTLSDVDEAVLKELCQESWAYMNQKYD